MTEITTNTNTLHLLPCLARLAQLQNVAADRLALQEVIASVSPDADARAVLTQVTQQLHLPAVRWLKGPDPSHMPTVLVSPQQEWGVLRGLDGQHRWVVEWWDAETNHWREEAREDLVDYALASVSMGRPFRAGNSLVYHLIRDELLSHKRLLLEAALGGVMINVLALATSFYTMQVYDRVIPTGASQTLLVLTLGALVAVVYELLAKKVRSRLYDRLIDQVDQRLARSVYRRFLQVRLDQLPQSVGSLAAQMRGYETVRSFLTGVISRLLIDAPFALLFVGVIASIAGPLALIPLTFFFLSIAIGWYYRARIDALTANANAASNFKTGMLVESVEGAETIKSGQAGWRMLSRWMHTTDEARDYETSMRNVSEHSQYLAASFQQFSYLALIASGALLVGQGQLTMGGLIACSILSGRILSPVAAIASQLVQWGHSKAALKALDALWALEDDHHGQNQPVVLDSILGGFRFEQVETQYGDSTALQVAKLSIKPGEKVGVLGPVGAGKTTFLRLLSGMYKPQQGRVLLDDVDLAHIAKPALAETMGFVQQEGRLFAGTLRENLTLGLLDPGDQAILHAARVTGLLDAVIASHPQGLQRPIHEGGRGLSGGQRQLVTLTRAFLRKPTIWLLDEPTASMDRNLELQVQSALRQALQPNHSLILVTHKPEMLDLVDRLIVIADQKVVMDGSKADVLRQLQQGAQKQAQKQGQVQNDIRQAIQKE